MSTQPTAYFIFKDAIVVHAGEQTFTISKDDPRYAEVLQQCVTNRLDRLANLSEVTDQRKLNKLIGLNE